MVDEQLEEEQEQDARLALERDRDLTDASSAGERVPGATRPVKGVDPVDLQGPDERHQICRRGCVVGALQRSANSAPRSACQAKTHGSGGGVSRPRLPVD